MEVLESVVPPPPSTPSAAAAASPSSAKEKKETSEEAADGAEDAVPEPAPTFVPPVVVKPAADLDVFEDELRGYRLLKAAGVNNDQRMQILTLTSNSVRRCRLCSEIPKKAATRQGVPHAVLHDGWGERPWDEEATGALQTGRRLLTTTETVPEEGEAVDEEEALLTQEQDASVLE